MKQVGVVGATGFIGGNLVNYLSCCADIHVEPYLRIRNGLESFIKRSDIIVHAAGVNRGTYEEMVDSNVNFLFKVSELCNKHQKKLIYIGTMYNKKDSYGFTKQIAESIVKSHIDNFNCNFYVMRLPNVIGRGCKPYYNSFLTTVLYEYSRGNKDVKLKIKDINESITFVTVGDVSEAVFDLIVRDNYYKIFDYPQRRSMSWGSIIELLAAPCFDANEDLLDLLEYYKDYDNLKK